MWQSTRPVLRQTVLLLTCLLLAACLPVLRPETRARTVSAGERLVSESFSQPGGWSQFTTSQINASVRDGVYRLSSRQPGQYIWGTTTGQYDDTIIDVDVNWSTSTPTAFAGVICRLHPENGRGYYVVVSSSGDFSIRYVAQNVDDPLVRWQAHSRIPSTGSLLMRVICVDDYIALYVNGQYIDGATDDRLRDGTIGLALGLPPGNPLSEAVLVEFDNLRVWEASLP